MPVAAADRQPGDEVMEDEVVETTTPGRLRRVDDPAVRVRVVADVVERDVRRRAAAAPRDDDVDPLLERGEQVGAVVGDPRALRRQRAVVRDLHERSVSMQRSHVTRAASLLPASPYARASSGCSRRRPARASSAGSGEVT